MPPSSPLSNRMKLTKYAKLAYQCLVNNFLTLLLIPIVVSALIQFNFLQIVRSSIVIILLVIFYSMLKPPPVYLLDYACYKPPEEFRLTFSTFVEHLGIILRKEPENVNFQARMLERSGLGEETCLSNPTHEIPPNRTVEAAKEEAEQVIFSAVDSLFKKTGIKSEDVDILVVNCSLFSPSPSLTDMVINKFKMRSDIKSFNLSGMGCSAGLISIDLACALLRVHPNTNAVVVSTETLARNLYQGKERSMLLPNCLFRMGGAAVLLSNRRSDRRRAKYQFLSIVRTHIGADDRAYHCAFQDEDEEGEVGLSLTKDLIFVAGEALKSNIGTIGPLVLPRAEKLLFLISLAARKFINPKWKPYIPDFKQAFEHFCIHPGGRAVIDALQKKLQLSPEDVEASRMTLHRFGNTSTSSLWYELSYIEAKGRMKKGDRVWQIGLGSGFKCNSARWKCNKTINTPTDGPWLDCIDRYPVHIPDVV